MKTLLLVAVMAAFTCAVSGFAGEAAAPAPIQTDAPQATCFVCVKCLKLATTAGQCCGRDMTPVTVISIKDGAATCRLNPGSSSRVGEAKDGQSTYSQPVVRCDLIGKFICEKCGKISDTAGKCSCHADLVEVSAKESAKKEYVTNSK